MKTINIIFNLIVIVLLFTVNITAQDGTLDQTFGVEGVVETSIEIDELIQQKLLPDNKMLILGRQDTAFVIFKVNEDGSIDNSFGAEGRVKFESGVDSTVYRCDKMDVLENGKILLLENRKKTRITIIPGGEDQYYAKTTNSIIRLNSDGDYDNEFGENGVLKIYTFESDSIDYSDFGKLGYLYDVNVRPNNTILVKAINNGLSELLRLNYDGSYDLSFGSSGVIPGAKYFKVDYSENIYLFSNFSGGFVEIRKYSQDGIRDYSFGSSGTFRIEVDSIGVGENHSMWIEGIDIELNNNILCAVRVETGGLDKSVIFRVTPDGFLDTTFGDNGVRIIDLSEFGSDYQNESREICSMIDGSIIWGGLETDGLQNSYNDFFIAKFAHDGTPDNSFDNNGIVFNNSFDENISAADKNYEFVVRPDNQNIVISTTKNDTLYFVRYLNSRTYSSVHVSGDVVGFWDADTIYVDGDITIPINEELTIRPNTYVYFTGEYKFDVYGTLTAKGTEADSIFFCSDSLGEISSWPYYVGFWYGITFHSTDENGQTPSSLDYCNIKYAFPTWLEEMMNRYGGGLVFYKSQVEVQHTTLTDCMDENLDRGVFTAIHSNGKISDISFIKKTGYSAGTLVLLSSDVNIENLNMDGAFGLYFDSSKVKINKGVIANGKATYSQWGVLNSLNSEVEIDGLEISDNNGTGIFSKFSTFNIKHTILKNNNGDGGLFIESPSTFTNCEIIGNGGYGLRFQTAQNWGTTFTSDIQNCVIAQNGATGIKFWSRNTANITNCTIADNTSSTGWGGVSSAEVDVHLKNSIVYNNGNDLDFQAGGLYTYSIIQGNYVGSDTATTNIQNVDPLFRDAANGDYHLQSIACGSTSDSPGIDAGDPNIGDFVLNCESGGLGTILSDIGAYGGANNWWDKSILPNCHFMGEVSGVWECEEISVDGNITIPEGDTLIISEAVDKVIITGPYQIKVKGVLLAIGAEREGVTKLDADYIKFQGDNWHGIYFSDLNNSNVGTSIIENCRFDYADKMDMTYQGGGAVAIYNSDKVVIKHSLFYANNARFGGAMYIENSNPHIEDCYFELNGKEIGQTGTAVTTAGGALYIKTSNPYLHKLQFINNYSISGGGAIVVDNSSTTISNVLLAENETEGMGGAIEVIANTTGSLLKIVNMTSANNVSIENGGGTFHTHGENTELEVINSIMFDNTKVELFYEGEIPTVTYSLIDSASTESYFGIGCLDNDPLFDENYRLSTSLLGYSPAIDAGHPDSLDAVLSENEGQGSFRADMGFYGGRYSEMPVGVDENKNTIIPSKYSLSQNYPNPFNPSTTIKYSVPVIQGVETRHALSVQLKIYDILGREVAVLVNKKQKPGNYKVNFDAGKLSSGIYFYRIVTNDFTDVKKMMLLK